MRRRGLAVEVAGFVRREQTAREAVAAGAVDRAVLDLAEAVDGADLVVLGTPVAQMAAVIAQCASGLAPGAVVTDVGSAKAAVVAAVEEPLHRAGARFVGSHPMAGSERTGVRAAREDLFAAAVVVVTPTAASDTEAVERTAGLWQAVGARVLRMSPERHDELVSRSSHLPHLVAVALARYILGPGQAPEQGQLCATGFRDTTRVASGSPEMWRDIALANRPAILAALAGFATELAGLRAAIEAGDGTAIEALLREGKERRDGWSGGAGKAVCE